MFLPPPTTALQYIAELEANLARATHEYVANRATADGHEAHKEAIRATLRPSKGIRLPSAVLDGIEVSEADVDIARKLQTTASRRAARAFDAQCRILDDIRRSLDYFTCYPGIAGEASRLAHQDVGVFAEVVGAREMFLWFWPTAITTSDEQATAAVGVVYGSNGISLIDGKMVALGSVGTFSDALKFIGSRMSAEVAADDDDRDRCITDGDAERWADAATPSWSAPVVPHAERPVAEIVQDVRPATTTTATEMVTLAFTESQPKDVPLPFVRIVTAKFTERTFPRTATAALEMFDGLKAWAVVSENDWKVGSDIVGVNALGGVVRSDVVHAVSHSTQWLRMDGGTCVIQGGKWVRGRPAELIGETAVSEEVTDVVRVVAEAVPVIADPAIVAATDDVAIVEAAAGRSVSTCKELRPDDADIIWYWPSDEDFEADKRNVAVGVSDTRYGINVLHGDQLIICKGAYDVAEALRLVGRRLSVRPVLDAAAPIEDRIMVVMRWLDRPVSTSEMSRLLGVTWPEANIPICHMGDRISVDVDIRWAEGGFYRVAPAAPKPDGGETVSVAEEVPPVTPLILDAHLPGLSVSVADEPVPRVSDQDAIDFASWLVVNDAVEGLRGLPEGIIDCVVTSPPYYCLRDYCVGGQIGLEQSPDEYIERLVAVFREVRRVLADHGTVWINIGDSYHTDGRRGSFGTKPKDLLGIPWMLAFALRADGWYLRSEIIWSKACGMPESVRDRPTKSHETVFLLSKREIYFYDNVAVKEPAKTGHRGSKFNTGKTGRVQGDMSDAPRTDNGTRSLRDVWHLPTTPFKGAHFATMPRGLAEICIQAGTSERGKCPDCGAPWVRQCESIGGGFRTESDRAFPGSPQTTDGNTCQPVEHREAGWRQTCTCASHQPVPALVLDPFMGAGTTALVANRLGRFAVGTEINPDFAEIARVRLGDSGFRMGIDFQVRAAGESILEQAA